MARDLNERQVRFVERPRIGRLGSTRRDGLPHVSPVWYRYEDGDFLVLVDRGSQKHRNIERDPRVVLCIDDASALYHTVLLRGRALVEAAPGPAWRLALAVHYPGEESGGGTWRRLTARTGSCCGLRWSL